jgi:hypothetical protein
MAGKLYTYSRKPLTTATETTAALKTMPMPGPLKPSVTHVIHWNYSSASLPSALQPWPLLISYQNWTLIKINQKNGWFHGSFADIGISDV